MREPLKDQIAMLVVKNLLTKRIRYWVLIHEGVTQIRDHEIVPEVPFTVVLERAGKEMRG